MEELNLILAAMLALTPEPYRPAEGSHKAETYFNIASDIYTAAHDPLRELPFEGPSAVEATEYALVAIGANESSYRQEVRDCRIKGDHGRSVSLFQLHQGTPRGGRKEKDICENPPLAARLAINVLGWYAAVSRTEQLFNGYATGAPNFSNYASATQHRLFTKLVTNAKIKISRKKGFAKLYAEPADDSAASVVSSADDSRLRTSSFTP